jgi:DNA-binding SARP family transcriptional activator/tetratricopeptide (TPR) repeat protein
VQAPTRIALAGVDRLQEPLHAPELRVRLFGHVAVTADGVPFNLATPRKTLPLLAYLLLHRETPLARDFLSFLVWPDETEEAARAKLRANLYDLSRILPPAPPGHWLIVDGNNLQWNPQATLWLDVDEFTAAASDPLRLEEALELYNGELLAQLYDEWVFLVRERLRNLYLATLTQAISSARRKLDFPTAIAHAQELLAIEPFREDIVRRLIALRNESGDRAGALNEFRRFAQHVRTELGIDPMPETVAVRDAIAHGEALAEPDDADDELATQTQSSTQTRSAPGLPFVGRHAELEQMLDAWSRAARGRGSVFFVGGEAGIGKTRLALELAHAVEERGGRVLFGATGSPEAIPYQCIVTALRSALPLVEALRIGDVWLSTLATLLPELQSRRGALPPPPHVDPAGERPRLFEALTRALDGLARARPLLLVLEDLHWAEEATIAALAFLLRRVSLAPILIVATFRDHETSRLHPLRRLRRDAAAEGVSSISLRPLTLGDVEELEPLLGPRTKRPAKKLLTESAGSPLFLTQLLDDDAREDDGKTGLRALVGRRIERLSPGARTIAEIAALIGAQFSSAAIREVCGWDEADVGDALGELIDRRIVREAGGRGLFDYSFGHEIVREVVAETVPANRAGERHRRIALVLDELAPERSEEIAAEVAQHYDLAGDAEAAARHYLVAARRSMELGAPEAAGAQLARALALTTEPRLRAEAFFERDLLGRRTGERALRVEALDELDLLATSLNDEEMTRTALLRRIQFAREIEDHPTHHAALLRLRGLVAYDQSRWRGILHIEECIDAYESGDLDQSYAAAGSALAAYREAGDEGGEARSLLRLAEVETQRGRLDRAEALLLEARKTAERAREGGIEIESLKATFYLLYNKREMTSCLATAESWLERGNSLGDRAAEAAARQRMAITLTALHRRDAEAHENFALAEAFFQEIDDRRDLAAVALNRAVLHAALCEFTEATSETERAVKMFEALNDSRGTMLGFVNLALVRALGGDPARAIEDGLKGIEIARTGDYALAEASAFENMAVAEMLLGNLDTAIEHGEAALVVRQRSQGESWTAKGLADLALCYAARGDMKTARERIERMLATEAYVTGTEWPQFCHWAAARILKACGDEKRAVEALDRAKGVVDAMVDQLDPVRRERYLNVSWNGEIVEAAERGIWPTFEPAGA